MSTCQMPFLGQWNVATVSSRPGTGESALCRSSPTTLWGVSKGPSEGARPPGLSNLLTNSFQVYKRLVKVSTW